jgi:hypothetical protein
MKYISKLYKENVRAVLGDKTIDVPKKTKFHEIHPARQNIFIKFNNFINRLNPVKNDSDLLAIIGFVFIIISIVFVILGCVESSKEMPRQWIFIVTSILCFGSFVTASLRNGLMSSNAWMWGLNCFISIITIFTIFK